MNEVEELLDKLITARPAFKAFHGMYSALQETLKIHKAVLYPPEPVANQLGWVPRLICEECSDESSENWPCATVSAIKACLDRHVKE